MILLIAAAALVLNPAVTQQTVSTTICLPHYASTYRSSHPIHLPTRKGYVRDHIVSLELGGSSDPRNVQYQSKADAHRKDLLENQLKKSVCSGKVSLRDAQLRMEAWR